MLTDKELRKYRAAAFVRMFFMPEQYFREAWDEASACHTDYETRLAVVAKRFQVSLEQARKRAEELNLV